LAVTPKQLNENCYLERLYIGYLGTLVGVVMVLLGVYLLLVVWRKHNNLTNKILIENKGCGRVKNPKAYLIEMYHKKEHSEKRPKYYILIDIGLVITFIGFILWTLAAIGIFGSSDVFSNPFFDFGTIMVSIGAIFVGIGGVLMVFLKS